MGQRGLARNEGNDLLQLIEDVAGFPMPSGGRHDEGVLWRGVAAGTMVGLVVGLMLALFIAIRPELFRALIP